MNKRANELLADVRAYTVELTNSELTEQDCERLQLMVDVFRQIRADGVPDYPIAEYLKKRHGFETDNDGQSVIYLDDGPVCPSCGDGFDVEVEDGEDCLVCQAEG